MMCQHHVTASMVDCGQHAVLWASVAWPCPLSMVGAAAARAASSWRTRWAIIGVAGGPRPYGTNRADLCIAAHVFMCASVRSCLGVSDLQQIFMGVSYMPCNDTGPGFVLLGRRDAWPPSQTGRRMACGRKKRTPCPARSCHVVSRSPKITMFATHVRQS